MRLTSFYVAAPVCTPSRAALMTGCYPRRVGLDVGSRHAVLLSTDPHGLNPDEKTVAEILKDAGYATGCFGKWHLGDQPKFFPTNHGFDTFYGIPYSNDIWPLHHRATKKWGAAYPPLPIMRDDKVVGIVKNMDDQAQLCKLFTDEAVAFIRKNRERPFFVYLPHAFVHHPRNARKEFMDKAGEQREFDEDKLASDAQYAMRQRTRAQIEEVDWSVGQVLDTLRELKLDKHTMVIFTSDNGGSRGCSNGPLRGGKGGVFEGGMREPTLAWWPGSIPARSCCDEIATTMDLLPTFAALAAGELPRDRVIDGRDITPLLRGRAGAKSPHEAFFYYQKDQLKAVRSGGWKLHTSGQLYDLVADIGERKNVAAQNPQVVARLTAHLQAAGEDLGRRENCRPVGKVASPRALVPPPQAEPSR
jgi:arylsulfatase A-like enzyme